MKQRRQIPMSERISNKHDRVLEDRSRKSPQKDRSGDDRRRGVPYKREKSRDFKTLIDDEDDDGSME